MAGQVAVLVGHAGVGGSTDESADGVEAVNQRKADDGGDERQDALGESAADVQLQEQGGQGDAVHSQGCGKNGRLLSRWACFLRVVAA